MIKESEVFERIGVAVDKMGVDDLANLHNYLTNHHPITGYDIEPTEGWHLVAKEGSH